MNILLINNVASFHSTLAESLNKIPGVTAKYIVKSRHAYVSKNEYEVFFTEQVSKRTPFKYLKHVLTNKRNLKKHIQNADVIYYLFDNLSDNLDLPYAYAEKKLIYIEWIGSDIRNPEKLKRINPWYKKALDQGYEYKEIELSDFKERVQAKFAHFGAKVISTPEMKLYLNNELFPQVVSVFQRINLDHFEPRYPPVEKKKVKIIHSPSAPVAKGTAYIREIISELQEEYDIEFVYLSGISRQEVLDQMKSTDLFIDQIICGSHGMAACEAMAFGKPVFCFLLPELYELGLPESCPIINSNPANLKDHLITFINDPLLRNEVGKKSREYVETYHDSDKIAKQLLSVFEHELNG